MSKTYTGQLEIDHNRGVIYFHQDQFPNQQPTLLRICNLDKIPHNAEFIDITHLHGLWIEPTTN